MHTILKCLTGTLAVSLLGCFPAFAYTNLGNNVFQSDGSLADTQSAVNNVPDGGTVRIPNGTYTWSSSLTIQNKTVHLLGQSTNGVTIHNANSSAEVLSVNKSTTGYVEVANLYIDSVVSSSYLSHLVVYTPSGGGLPVLLHDCTFVSLSGGVEYGITWNGNGGVIWNCHFYSGGSDIEGIQFYSANSDWTYSETLGMDDTNGTHNTYVEDCDFHNAWTAATNFDDNSRVVIRNCTLDNTSLTNHGQETSPWGVRQFEIYNNTFTYATSGTTSALDGSQTYPLNLNYWCLIRGGTGVICNNVLPSILWGKTAIVLAVFSINRVDAIPCQTSYPAARQVGQGWNGTGYSYPSVPQDGSGYFTDPLYIWGNTGDATTGSNYVGLDQYTPDECGNGQLIGNYLQQGRDYIVGTARPGYAPYTYPHPLRASLGGSNPVSSPTPAGSATPPSAPQNLRIVQ